MIVKMKKTQIVVLAAERSALLLTLQKGEFMEITSTTDATFSPVDVSSSMQSTNNALNILDQQKAIKEKKPKKVATLKEDSIKKAEFRYDMLFEKDIFKTFVDKYARKDVDVKESEMLQTADETRSLIESITHIESEKKELLTRNTVIDELCHNLVPFKTMTSLLSDIKDSELTTAQLYSGDLKDIWALNDELKSLDCAVECYQNDDSEQAGILIVNLKQDNDTINSVVSHYNLNHLSYMDSPMTAASYSLSLKEEENKNNSRLVDLDNQLSALKEKSALLGIEVDRLTSLLDRESAPAVPTDMTYVYTGWVREDRCHDLQHELDQALSTYDIEFTDPTPDDDIPTCMENNKIVKPFESITNMFDVPNYFEKDPNPVMSVWYWLLFGLMVGDLGYGLAMALAIGLFLKIKRPKGGIKDIATILFYSSITTALAGIFYNSFFGFSLFGSDSIFGANSIFGTDCFMTKVCIPPIASTSAMKLLIFSIIVGALHLMTGLVNKTIADFQEHNYFDALAHTISWMCILIGGGLFALSMVSSSLGFCKIIGLILVIIGFLCILIFSGYDRKGIVGKAMAAFSGIYNVTSWLSDLLSYTRIMALVMASAAIAYVMNLLASMVGGSGIGIIFSIVIYIGGHIFNLVLGLLSAYVHDCRLQYIEYFGKFYTGGGRLFKPLSYTKNHIDNVK